MQKFKDFAIGPKEEKIPAGQFNPKHAFFLRAKLECELTLAEELELQSFPFDCQDLSCVIHERTADESPPCIFLPELRKENFASVDPRYSVIDEWDLETAMIEFGSTEADISQKVYPMIVIRLKMKRRWKVYLWNVCFMMVCICSMALTAFSISPIADDGDRLNLLITLVLTAVAFNFVVLDDLPRVPYLTFMDKYILSGYTFLTAIMVESGFIIRVAHHIDYIIFWIAAAVLILYHVYFAISAVYARRDEANKLSFSSDEIEQQVNLTRSAIAFDYTKRIRAGKDGRLLTYVGGIVIPPHMKEEEKRRILQNQHELETLYHNHIAESTYEETTVSAHHVQQPTEHVLFASKNNITSNKQ